MRTVVFALLLGPIAAVAQRPAPAASDSVRWTTVDSLQRKELFVIIARDARTGAPVSRPMVCTKNSLSSIPFWVGSATGVYVIGNAPPTMHLRILGPNHEARDLMVTWSEAVGRQVVVPLRPLSSAREPKCGWE